MRLPGKWSRSEGVEPGANLGDGMSVVAMSSAAIFVNMLVPYLKTGVVGVVASVTLFSALSGCNKGDTSRGFQPDNPAARTSESTANVQPGKHSHGGKKKGKKKGGKSNGDKTTPKPGKGTSKPEKPAAPATEP